MQLVVSIMMRPRGVFNKEPRTPPVKNMESAARTESDAKNKKETPLLIFMPLSWHINKAQLNSYMVDLIPHMYVDLPLCIKIHKPSRPVWASLVLERSCFLVIFNLIFSTST